MEAVLLQKGLYVWSTMQSQKSTIHFGADQ